MVYNNKLTFIITNALKTSTDSSSTQSGNILNTLYRAEVRDMVSVPEVLIMVSISQNNTATALIGSLGQYNMYTKY